MTELNGGACGVDLWMPVLRQPDGITCGPTSLMAMALALAIRNGASRGLRERIYGMDREVAAGILRLGNAMGTCVAYGTRDIEMAAGLYLLSLPVTRGVEGVPLLADGTEVRHLDPWPVLRAHILSGHAVLLRTLWYGCKHWVLLYPEDAGVAMLDPASGAISTRVGDEVVEPWAHRGYDGFSVPLDSCPDLSRMLPEFVV